MHNDLEDWSGYWQDENPEGEVFANLEGRKNPAVVAFWQQQLANAPTKSRIIDLAAGAGSIFNHLVLSESIEWHACDLSHAALVQHRRRTPGVLLCASSADRLPYRPGHFDVVLSQFGLEYAGLEAFSEAASLVRPGGSMSLLCHIENGFIDKRSQSLQGDATVARDSGFVEAAIELTQAAFSGSMEGLQHAYRGFVEPERKLSAALANKPAGLHSHLYGGFRRLFESRDRYDQADIIGWLEAMKQEIDRLLSRLATMRKAALSEGQVKLIGRKLEVLGFDVRFAPYIIPEYAVPIAWHFHATRPGP